MSESERSTSVLDGLIIGEPMSQHHGVQCCPAIRESNNERYIVKILSIPTSSVQMDALLLTGAYSSRDHALEYFRKLADEVLEEVDILRRLNAMEGFLPYTESEVRKKEDGSGYQVYLVSPYKRSLERQMQLEPLTHLGAVNLGLDLCAALAICRRAGYLYMDLKPSNVFITPNQGYRISDLGFVSLSSLKYASYPEQYRSIYTAPEISDAMSSLNNRIDIYALGLILYQVYNNGQLPTEEIEAGKQLPPPIYADYEIAEIILKACDPNPTHRWADPLQMGQALVAYMQRNSINDTPIVPPPVEEPVTEPVEEPVAEPVEEVEEEPVSIEEPETEVPAEAEPETAGPVEEPAAEDLGAMLERILESSTPAAAAESVDISLEEEPALEDPELDISFIDSAPEDETVPTEESAADIQEELVSEEVQQMLARADELISHELPEPAVAPDPIDVPFPAPIVLPPEPEQVEPEAAPEEAVEEAAAAEAEEPTAEEEAAQEPEQEADASEEAEEESEEAEAETAPEEAEASPAVQKNTFAKSRHERYEFADDDEDDDEADWEDKYTVSEYYSDEQIQISKRAKNKTRILITVACSIVLLISLLVSGMLFYQYYYLQNVNELSVTASVDSLTTVIHSGIRDELLTVVCTDTYGNTYSQSVVNGRAHFVNLKPNTQYRVQVNVSGFHKLTGITSGSFTTLAQTEILNFTATGGPENGSVILSFTVNGPDLDTWTVGYSTGNSQEITQSFSGHTVTITNLQVGSEYLFRLIPTEDQHLAGDWQLKYTAAQLVAAQELAIRSCGNGTLVAVWSIPEGSESQSWNVRCYNENGYDKTITTTEGQAQFTELDHAFGYTVEVTAVGMSQSATATVSANPITMKDIVASLDTPGALTVKWTVEGDAPADGWILDYTIDGGEPVTVSCTETTAEIPLYAGSTYEIDVRPAGEISFFGKHLSYTADAARKFSGYGVSADDMSFYMCLTPDKENWDRFDVPAPDYKTAFPVGVRASFLVELWKNYDYSEDTIIVTFVVRDEDGQPISRNSMESAWNLLWDKKFCELDIPEMPGTPGNYTVDIFFNNQQITSEAFSVI